MDLYGPVPNHIPEAEIDTTPWTQHGDAASLMRAVRALSPHARVVFFHDYPSRLAKVVRRNELQNCFVLTSDPIRV